MANLIGKEEWSNNKITSQVYQITHDGAGNSLPYMSRSFISFTFGGKAIEDFGLIVVNGGDRLERQAYTEFSDLTSTYDTLDGQIYWGSNLSANKLELDLATDEITEQQLDDFREWFAPGKERELILSEHPNRAILARVESVPTFSFLPFEKKTSIIIAKTSYETSTTLYKGEIKLSFIMDEPYWYAKLNYMPSYVDKKTLEKVEANSTNSNKIETINDLDMLKIMLEDGIPHQSILSTDMFLGGNILVTSEARTDSALVGQAYLGIITSASSGLSLINGGFQYLFYSGTAISRPTIQFEMLPSFNGYYISNPKNLIQNPSLTEFSTFSIGDKTLEFTTPSILTGYNQAVQIFSNVIDKASATVLSELREKVNEKYSRAWAVGCLNKIGSVTKLTNANQTTLLDDMKNFIETSMPMKFSINSKTGEAKGEFFVKVLEKATDTIGTAEVKLIKENVGDMICSDYLTIEGRNCLNSDGEITSSECKKISSNENLTNVLVFFNNMYL